MVINIKKYIYFLILFLLVSSRILYINLYKKDYYKNKLELQTKYYTYGLSAPRGRILDINGNIIVDNIKKRVIVYEKNKNISKAQELVVAKKLSKYLKDNYTISEDELAFYIFNKSNNIKLFLTSDEYHKLKMNIYSYNDAKDIAIKYIKENLINNISIEEKKIAKIYNLMNKDYSYDKKVIFSNVTDEEYFKIINESIPGVSGGYIYERIYPYEDLLRSILGNTGKINKDNKDDYLNDNYMLSDIVGISYLEKEYEKELRGKKAKYEVLSDGSLKLVKNEVSGSNITLNIDINIEKELSNILKKYI